MHVRRFAFALYTSSGREHCLFLQQKATPTLPRHTLLPVRKKRQVGSRGGESRKQKPESSFYAHFELLLSPTTMPNPSEQHGILVTVF